MGNQEKGIVRPGPHDFLRRVSILAIVALYFVSLLPFPFSPRVSRLGLAHAGSALVSTSTPEGRLIVFDDAWSAINQRYYEPGFNGLDWIAQRATYRSLAAAANSSEELYSVLRRMIAPLNDPHTRVFAPEEKFDWWRPRFVTTGIALREVDGFPTVVEVERDSVPRHAGIRAGDQIESVDGNPALSLINQRLSSLSFVTASSRYRTFATLLEGLPGTSVEIHWKRKNGSEGSAQFQRHWQQRDLGLRIHRERGALAVIEIDGFTKQIAANFTRAIREKLTGVQGLILDLRSNGGGDTEAMTDVASAFLRVGFGLGQFTGRDGAGFSISTRSRSPLMTEQITQTLLPVIVLTSERTASAAEIFIAALKASERARVIGTETCGCVLAVRTPHELPDGGLLDISELDYRTPSGDRLEGNGIKPDQTVIIRRNDLYSGHDRAIELAITKLTGLRRDQR